MGAAQPAAARNAAAPPLPAGTGVLVQRLVAKPGHSSKRARVASFDAYSAHYCMVLSLKAECLAPSGGMRVGGGEQRVFTMPGAAGTAPGMPARGLEGAQAGVRGSSTSIVVKCHSCIGESSSYVRLA
jgi:hypothetical protein